MRRIFSALMLGLLLAILVGCSTRGAEEIQTPLDEEGSSQGEVYQKEQDLDSLELPGEGCNSGEEVHSEPVDEEEIVPPISDTPGEGASDTPMSTQDDSAPIIGVSPIGPAAYRELLGHGMDVDWSKTSQGRHAYNSQVPMEFATAGVDHVRIRVKDPADEALFESLDQQIDDCLAAGLIPVLAYQADDFKNDPSLDNRAQVVAWWKTVAQRYQNKSFLLSFDLLIEATDALNKQPEALNQLYEEVVSAIRTSNPERIVFISPRLRSDPKYLEELAIPTEHNGFLMAEWHFYASGPSKKNDKKQWTTGTLEERELILEKIQLALDWQEKTGIPTWVGAWMPGNYNDGDDYTVSEQTVFASFVVGALDQAGIPFAVNSDTKFYDRERCIWIREMQPVFDAIFRR